MSNNKDKIHTYLLDTQNKCSEYSDIHLKKSKDYSKKNTIFNIINIVFTSGVATLTAATTNLDSKNTISIISSVLLYCSAVLNSVQQFLNFEKLAEQDLTLANRFCSLGNNIKKFLTLEELENKDLVEYFNWVSNTFEELLNKTSIIDIPKIEENNQIIKIESNEPLSYNSNEHLLNFDALSERERVKYEMDRFNVNSYSYK